MMYGISQTSVGINSSGAGGEQHVIPVGLEDTAELVSLRSGKLSAALILKLLVHDNEQLSLRSLRTLLHTAYTMETIGDIP
jgi:hypothetical protein